MRPALITQKLIKHQTRGAISPEFLFVNMSKNLFWV